MKRILLIILSISLFASCKNNTTLPGQEQPVVIVNSSPIEGLEFTYIKTPLQNILSTIYFVNEQIGYVADYNGNMFKTTDGGKSWTALITNTSSPINAIYFFNPNDGFAVGNVIIQTKDGGQTWKTLPIHTSEKMAFNSICFPTDSIGFAVGSGIILSTKNKGITWKETKIDDLGGIMMDVKFINQQQGMIACGVGGKLLKTTDQGINWKISNPFPAIGAYSLALVNEHTIYCAGSYNIAKSTDFGSTWSDLPWSTNVLKLIFTSENIGYAFGRGQYSGGDWGTYYGAIYYTTDGGSTWKGNDKFTKIGVIISANFPTTNVGYAISGNMVIKITRL